jgi:hypothetical protein
MILTGKCIKTSYFNSKNNIQNSSTNHSKKFSAPKSSSTSENIPIFPFEIKMKFSLPLIVATLASISAAAGTPAPSGIPSIPQACQEIPQAIGLKPIRLLKQFHEEVCEKGKCSATINEHNEYLVNDVFPKIISDLDEKLEISASNKQLFSQIRTQAAAAVKKSCNPQGEKALCDDPQGLFEWGSCALKASTPVYQKHMKELASASQLSEAQCQKLKALETDESVWNKTIPGYIETFAQKCETKN